MQTGHCAGLDLMGSWICTSLSVYRTLEIWKDWFLAPERVIYDDDMMIQWEKALLMMKRYLGPWVKKSFSSRCSTVTKERRLQPLIFHFPKHTLIRKTHPYTTICLHHHQLLFTHFNRWQDCSINGHPSVHKNKTDTALPVCLLSANKWAKYH